MGLYDCLYGDNYRLRLAILGAVATLKKSPRYTAYYYPAPSLVPNQVEDRIFTGMTRFFSILSCPPLSDSH